MTNFARASEEWEIVIDPFNLFGTLYYRLYFKHKKYPFKFLYRTLRDYQQACQEREQLHQDLTRLRTDRFMEKYQIGYHLKQTFL